MNYERYLSIGANAGHQVRYCACDSASAVGASSAVDVDRRRTSRWRRVISRPPPTGRLSTATAPTAPVDTARQGGRGRRIGVPGRIRRLCFDENDDIEPSTISVRSSAVMLYCYWAIMDMQSCYASPYSEHCYGLQLGLSVVIVYSGASRANNSRPLTCDFFYFDHRNKCTYL